MIIVDQVKEIVEKYLKEKICKYDGIGYFEFEENKFINYGKYDN